MVSMRAQALVGSQFTAQFQLPDIFLENDAGGRPVRKRSINADFETSY